MSLEGSHRGVTDAEIQLLRAFLVPNKRERYIGLATSKWRRQDFLRELYHFRHFDPRWIRNLKTDQNSPLAYYEGEGPFNRFILHRDR